MNRDDEAALERVRKEVGLLFGQMSNAKNHRTPGERTFEEGRFWGYADSYYCLVTALLGHEPTTPPWMWQEHDFREDLLGKTAA